MKKISEHISYAEAVKSNTAIKFGIDNTPDKATIERMKHVAVQVFEPLRNHFGIPIGVTSFYRSPALNKKIGGSSTSEHVYGSAIDIDADVYGMITNRDIFEYIKKNLTFNQLIWEFGTDNEPDWVHVSRKQSGNKNQILQAYRVKDWTGKWRIKYKLI